MEFSPVMPSHETIQNEQLNDASTNELAEKIVVVALGIVTALGTFLALLILGAPISFAASAAGLVGGCVSLLTYLTFQDKENDFNPQNSAEFQNTQREIDRQVQLCAELSQHLSEQEATREVEREVKAMEFLREVMEDFDRKKAKLNEDLKTMKNPDDPFMRKIYESQLSTFNNVVQLAFMNASVGLTPDAKARVFAPYQAEYSHLMSF